MVKKICVVLALVMFLGCAQLQPIGGNGRFLQQSINGRIIAQIDTDSPEACKREGNSSALYPRATLTCATFSQEAILPYAFAVTHKLTGERSIFRASTESACKAIRKEVDKLNDGQMYDVYGCR